METIYLGVATGFVYLVTPLETWDSKLSILLSSTDTTSTLFPEAEWIKYVLFVPRESILKNKNSLNI